MRRLLYFALLVGLSACEFYMYDPVYDSRQRVIGKYAMEEYSETYNDVMHYTVWIERSAKGAEAIWIENIYGSGIRVYAYISWDKITIPRQVVDGYEIEGVGTVHGDLISFNYWIKDLYSNYRTDFLEGTASKYY